MIPTTVGATDLGKVLGLSDRRVRQLVDQGVIPRAARGKYPLAGAVQGYIDWKLKAEVERRDEQKPGDELERERTRKLRLANDENERLLVRTEDAVAALDAIVGPIKSDLAGVPPRVTDDLTLRRQIEDQMDAVLGGLSERFRKACADLRSGRDALESAGADEPDGMGEEE